MKVVVMGVSGSGKSTLGANLAVELGAVFLDADDLHSRENIAHMKAGRPLTAGLGWMFADRPWGPNRAWFSRVQRCGDPIAIIYVQSCPIYGWFIPVSPKIS
jgi:hypothetical protein